MKIRAALLALLALASAPVMASAQVHCEVPAPDELADRPSPYDSASSLVGGTALKVCYGRPSLRGRPMIGGVLPYGSVWRLGANEPTTLHIPFSGHVAGVAVDPGAYSLYVDLEESEWTVHVNSNTARWGVPIDEAVMADDIGTGAVPVEFNGETVEILTIWFEAVDDSNVNMVVDWQNSRIRIPIHKM